MSSSSSLQDSSSLDEPQPFIDLFGVSELDNNQAEQSAKSKIDSIPKKTKRLSQELLESDSCNESEPSPSYNIEFDVRNRSKSHKEDIKEDFDRYIKLYCMFIGRDVTPFKNRMLNLVQNKHSKCSKSSFRIKNSHLKWELQRRYHYLKVTDTEPRYSNFETKRLYLYLNNDTYTLPKSESQYVKHEMSLFLQLHEVVANNKTKEKNDSCKKVSETDKKKNEVMGSRFLR